MMRVVIGTNGWGAAVAAERLVASLANPDSVEILLFCANAVEFIMPDDPLVTGPTSLPRAQPDDVLRDEAAYFQEAGFAVRTASRPGIPSDEILAYAREERAELIVVGAGDQSWSGRILWGGTATKLMHRSDVSVLAVQQAPSQNLVNVLVASDGSDHSARAIELFIQFVRNDRCRVKVLSVAEPAPTPVAELLGGYISIPASQEQIRDLSDVARAIVEVDAEKLTKAGFEVTTEIGLGSPARRILEVADKGSADLVVAGARGLGRFERFALGSVSDRIVRHCPATLVAHLHEGDG